VDWREWSEDAFAEVRVRDVPIFLSVGMRALMEERRSAPTP
jgi:uncharacterized protein YyaL (SSP411 family)